jgi:hypothetical protein
MEMLGTKDMSSDVLCRYGGVELFNHQDCMLPVSILQALLWFVQHPLGYHYSGILG